MIGKKGEQLQMFMPAAEIKSRVDHSGDLVAGENMPQMWDRKLEESKVPMGEYYHQAGLSVGEHSLTAHGTGVYDSMEEKGYDGPPVRLSHRGKPGFKKGKNLTVTDGNHRIAAADDLGKEVHVEHYDRRYDKINDANYERLSGARGWKSVKLGRDK